VAAAANDEYGYAMAPSELTHSLSVIDERLKTAYTVASSLLVFAVAAFVAVFAVRNITPNLAAVASAISVVGAAGAIAASRVYVWRREELYDEIVLSGYRHVGGDAVNRHAEALVSADRRLMLARTLERFLDISLRNQLTAVPLDRPTVRELEPHIRGLCSRVRAVDVDVHAAGMVLLRRLITDGVSSPLFRASTEVLGDSSELERAIASIHAHLGPAPVIRLFPAQSSEPLRLAA
jgi:hypothetical protein